MTKFPSIHFTLLHDSRCIFCYMLIVFVAMNLTYLMDYTLRASTIIHMSELHPDLQKREVEGTGTKLKRFPIVLGLQRHCR